MLALQKDCSKHISTPSMDRLSDSIQNQGRGEEQVGTLSVRMPQSMYLSTTNAKDIASTECYATFLHQWTFSACY